MEINTKPFTLVLVLLSFFHLSLVSGRKSFNGLTLDLIHRDSPLSPYHNPSITRYERLQNAFYRSSSRAAFFQKKCANTIQSTLTPNGGEFLMKISIGTPPMDTLVIADTGSDLTWTQCEPCYNCYKQLLPIFNPKNSSSYKTIGCKSKICQGDAPYCSNNACNYAVTYGDLSYTEGDLSTETFTFASTSGKNVSIPKIVFGCGHENSGTFSNATSGIIGLGGGNLSIVNQLDQQVKGKFSYCLTPLDLILDNSNVTSHINFGNNAVVSGDGVISTPLIKQEPSTYYYLNLKGISVGNKTVEFKSPPGPGAGGEGNIIIDSGTTLTYVPDGFYLNLESLLMRSINATRKDDPQKYFGLCYEANENGTINNVPKIVAHFRNADLELPTSNIFSQVLKGVVCLTIVPGEQLAIFGNLAQANFLVGYDLKARKLSFKPKDCTKY